MNEGGFFSNVHPVLCTHSVHDNNENSLRDRTTDVRFVSNALDIIIMHISLRSLSRDDLGRRFFTIELNDEEN